MKKYLLGAWLLLGAGAMPAYAQLAAQISPELAAEMQTGAATYDICILFQNQVNLPALEQELTLRQASLEERAFQVITRLQAKAEATQPDFLQWLRAQEGVEVNSIRPFWIVNAVFVKVNASSIGTIAAHPEVASLDLNHPVFLEDYYREPTMPKGITVANGKEIGLVTIGAPALWAMGYSGYSRIAMSMDTGVDPEHPAFKARYRGKYAGDSQSWFDPSGTSTTPNDCDGHGTHTVGTMVGLDPVTRDTIGVAFNGLWIAAQGICGGGSTTDKTIASFQWALDPDNDPGTINDMPDAINNSWFNGGLSAECQSLYVGTLTALETAGIAVVFSAGNSGPGISTITPPKNINLDLVNTFCVGAVAASVASIPIANFSSRGPSICGDTAALLIKPEVSAPGVNVRSSLPNGTYGNLSGTSMASPHVTGAIVLLKEAFPYLTGTQIKLALYFSATDLGPVGEDNDYGRGLINLGAAFQYLVSQGHIPVPPVNDRNVEFVEVLNLPAKVCSPNPLPVVVMKNLGNLPVTTALIRYTFDSQNWDTTAWAGNIPVGGVQPVVVTGPSLSPGTYRMQVEIISVNNQPDDRPLDNYGEATFTIATGPIPSVTAGEACQGARALLQAQVLSGDVRWYSRSTGGQLLGKGALFLTPPLLADTAFYAEGYEPVWAGLADTIGRSLSPALGALRFEALQGFTLESVTVYATGAGFAFIVLKDTLGQIINSTSKVLQAGKQILPVDFDIESRKTYLLEISGTGNLLAVSSGVNYPLVQPGVINITGSTLSGGAYPGIFDWKIASNPSCLRRRVIARARPGGLAVSIAVSDTLMNRSLGQSIQFTDQTPGSVSRIWSFGDGQTDTSKVVNYQYQVAGSYLATLQSQGNAGCGGAATQKIVVIGERPTSITDPSAGTSVTVYPNPNNGSWKLHFSGITQQMVSLNLYDLSGKLVWKSAKMTDVNGDVVVSVGDVANGVYALRWNSGNLPGTSLIQIVH